MENENTNQTSNFAQISDFECQYHQLFGYIILVMAIGFLTTALIDFGLKLWNNGRFSFWINFSIICYVLLIIALELNNMKTICSEKIGTKARSWFAENWPRKKMGNSLFGIGSTMVFVKLFYFLQLSSITGPVAISLKKVMKPVGLVFFGFTIMLLSFGFGSFYLMKDLHVNTSFHEGKPVTLSNIWNTLFWSLWSLRMNVYGERGQVEQYEERYTAMLLFAFFMLFNSVILMNVLIALMSQTLIIGKSS